MTLEGDTGAAMDDVVANELANTAVEEMDESDILPLGLAANDGGEQEERASDGRLTMHLESWMNEQRGRHEEADPLFPSGRETMRDHMVLRLHLGAFRRDSRVEEA